MQINIEDLYENNLDFLQRQMPRNSELFYEIVESSTDLNVYARLACASSVSLTYMYASNQHRDILDKIIEKYYDLGFPDEILGLIWSMYQLVSPTRSNFKTIFNRIKDLYHNKCSVSQLGKSLSLLEFMFKEKKHYLEDPSAYLVFNGPGSGIQVDHSQLPRDIFKNGFTFVSWIYAQEQIGITHLLSVTLGNSKFDVSMENHQIYYSSTHKGNYKKIALTDLVVGRWVPLTISVEYQRNLLRDGFIIKVSSVNTTESSRVDFPNLEAVTSFKLFDSFYGMISSCLLFNDIIPPNIQYGDHKFGIQKQSHIKQLLRSVDKYASRLIFCYTPLRSEKNSLFDFVRRNDAIILGQTAPYVKQYQYRPLAQICKIETFLPLFQFLGQFKYEQYPELLNQLIRLITSILQQRPESQKDAIGIDLLSILGLQINNYGLDYAIVKTIEMFQEMKNALLEKQLKQRFLPDLVWKVDFQKFRDFETTKAYVGFIRACYNQSPEVCTESFGVSKILEQAQLLEPQNMLCCEEHAKQLGIWDIDWDQKIQYKDKISCYTTILEAILYYYFFDKAASKDLGLKSFKELLISFSQRHTPCFFTEIISLLLRLCRYERVGSHPVTVQLASEESLKNITHVLTFCNCPQVKTGCIKLIAEAIRICGYQEETNLGIWIGHTLGNTAAAQQISDIKVIIDHEPLYVAVMEWCLRRQASNQDANEFIIDETDILCSQSGMHVLTNLYSFANQQVRGRVMQDLCMLVKWNKKNCLFMLKYEQWIQRRLLEIMIDDKDDQYENWIWDTCLRMYGILMRYTFENEVGGARRFSQLGESLHALVSLYYPGEDLQARMAFRFIAKYTVQGLHEVAKQRNQMNDLFWKNIQQLVHTVVKSLFDDQLVPSFNNGINTFELWRYASQRQKMVFVNNPPKRWVQCFGQNEWLDHSLIEVIQDLILMFCSKLQSLNVSLEDFQMTQRALTELLDYKYYKDHQGLVDALLHRHFLAQEFNPPFTIQLFFLSIQLSIEYYSLNPNVYRAKENLQKSLKTLDYLYKVFVTAVENARERECAEEEEYEISMIVVNHICFLYETSQQINNAELLACVKEQIMWTFKFLLILIEVETQKVGQKGSYADLIMELYHINSVPPFKMMVAKVFEAVFRRDDQDFIPITEIKNMKLSNALLSRRIEQPILKELLLGEPKVTSIMDQFYAHLGEEYVVLYKMTFQETSFQLQQKFKSIDMEINLVRQQFENTLIELAQESFTVQEEARLHRSDTHEAWLRNARYRWRKLWNSVRLFEEPWTPSSFQAQNDQVFDPNNYDYQYLDPNQNFAWKVWKYQTKQRTRPLLKIKLFDQQEQPITDQDILQQRDLKLFVQPVQKEKQSSQSFSIVGGIIKGIKNSISQPVSEDIFIPQVMWIKSLTVRNGQMKITDSKLIFYFQSISQRETHQSLVKYKVPYEARLIKEWDITKLSDIVKRRYIGRKNSLELQFIDGSSLVFAFPLDQYDSILERFYQMKKSKCLFIKPYFQPNKHAYDIITDTQILPKWYSYEMSTFEYLMKLNKISGRSYKDLTQYPVVPWIMHGGEQIGCYRDLTKPMGALGNAERANEFMSRYNTVDHFNKVPQYHYGSHYSSPAIVYHFLVRLRPYADGAKELQSGKFDLADRLFFNFVDTYKNATEELSDVRELVPEFYYLPEMLINHSKYDFGYQQTGGRVNNVELPDWSDQNPYKFICVHRLQMETDYVSQHINHWIDLIFGYKQRGEEAAKALNTFYYLTYEDAIDLNSIQNEKQRVSYESQMVHFGQTPGQIFTLKHPKRPAKKDNFKIVDEQCQGQVFRQKLEKGVKGFDRSKAITTLQFINETKILVARNNGEISTIRLNSLVSQQGHMSFEIVWENEYAINLQKMDHEGYIFDYHEIPKVFFRGGKVSSYLIKQFILVGGIWDGRLVIFNLDDSQLQEVHSDQQDTITAIGTDNKQRVIATGSKNGTLCIYHSFPWQNNLLKLIAIHYHHNQQITNIYICDDLRAIATCSLDGTINLYNMFSGKYLRSYHHPKYRPLDSVCLFNIPLYGIVFYCAEELMIYSYSINGQFLATFTVDACLPLKISKDSSRNDILLIPTNDGKRICQLTTPFLYPRQDTKLTGNLDTMAGITAVNLSPKGKYMAFGTRDGEFGVVVDKRLQNQ